MKKVIRSSQFAFRCSQLSQPFLFSNFFTPALKGEVAENQAPFRVWGKTDFQRCRFHGNHTLNAGGGRVTGRIVKLRKGIRMVSTRSALLIVTRESTTAKLITVNRIWR